MPPAYANGHISATGDPIHLMFGSRVGFSGTAERTALFTVQTNPRWRPLPCWKNFKWPYLRNRSSDPLHVWLYSVSQKNPPWIIWIFSFFLKLLKNF